MDLALKVGADHWPKRFRAVRRIQEGVVSLGGYADIFLTQHFSQRCRAAKVASWARAPAARLQPAITDLTSWLKDTSYMFITGPMLIKTVTHERRNKEELGGAATHNRKSGVAHFAS